MTKEEAIKLMELGALLTHKSFSEEEWVTIDSDGSYLFEDGVKCAPEEFWQWRQDESWEIGWKVHSKCDLYTCLAAKAFSCDESEVDKSMRDAIKIGMFGSIYGGCPVDLETHTSLEEAYEAVIREAESTDLGKCLQVYYCEEPLQVEVLSEPISEKLEEAEGTIKQFTLEFTLAVQEYADALFDYTEELNSFIRKLNRSNRKSYFVPKDTTKLRKGYPKKQYWLRIRSNPTRRKKPPSR